LVAKENADQMGFQYRGLLWAYSLIEDKDGKKWSDLTMVIYI